MSKEETVLVTKIKKELNKMPRTFFFKVWGNGTQMAGISDLIGICNGRFVALEVKVPGKENTLTALQRWFLTKIKLCGGVAEMITSVEEALKIVHEI
jgi:hypothetical protein